MSEVLTIKEGYQESQEDEVFSVPDEEETEDVYTQSEEEESESIVKGTFRLINPINYEGRTIRELHYDFSVIKPIEYINLVKAVQKKENAQVPELNMSVQFNMFCKAVRIPVSVLKGATERVDEFTAMCQKARDFLLNRQSHAEEVL